MIDLSESGCYNERKNRKLEERREIVSIKSKEEA